MTKGVDLATGQRIREAREDRGMTTTELAYHVGKSAQTVMAYENGSISPPLDVIRAIAERLDVSIDHLAGRARHE